MTSEELKKLIKTGKNGVVEFKCGCGGVPGDFWSSYSAFANMDGGVIKANTKKTCSKSEKTRGKKCADSVSPLKNKDETMKTVGKKTVGKGEKTRGKSFETRGKKAECLL